MIPSAAMIIEDTQGRILLLKRGMTAPWMPGKWNLPGGGGDLGETPAETAIREALEETALRVFQPVFVTIEDLGPDVGILEIYHSRYYSGTVKICWESSEHAWVPKAEALSYDLVPGIAGAIEKITHP